MSSAPLISRRVIPSKTLTDLGWGTILDRMAARAHTERGAAAVRDLGFFEEALQAEERIAAVSEARTLIAMGAAMAFGGITDARPAIARAAKGGALDPEALIAVGSAARGCQRLGEHLERHADRAPLLAAIAAEISELGHVHHPILEAFDPDGRLVDHASDSLGELRRRASQLEGALERRLETMLEDSRYSKHLQDRYYTLRDDRFVVPIKVESRTWVKGIIHGTSQSGHTLFIEPDEIVDANNAVKLAECEVADEERRILAELTRFVAEDAEPLVTALDVITTLDVIAAAGRFADDIAAEAPVIDRNGVIELRAARHPIMVAGGKHCVPNDIVLAPRSVLVVSGPNAGGKTVALKTTGLAALMVRAGLHIAASTGSRLPWFRVVFTDIGDSQSIEKDLSTFSAHLEQLEQFLREADSDTLLLVDEIAVGTEPEQGAALARAVLESLADRGTPAIVTTHYEILKSLASSDPRFSNASVGFDLERLEPTFELRLGTPGSSGGLRLARRMGLPEEVVARAEAILGAGRRSVEEILAELEEVRGRLADERAAADEARLRAERLAREADEARRAADDRRKRLHEQGYDEALTALREARTEIDELRQRLKRRKVVDAGEARSDLQRLAETVAEHVPPRPAPPGIAARAEDLQPGTRVFVPSIGGEGVVSTGPDRGRVVVQIGALKTTVELSDLRLLPRRGARKPSSVQVTPTRAAPPTPRPPDDKAYARTADATLDLRGGRVEESLAELDRYIDRSLRESREVMFVIHGHGTGALRRAVREQLQTHPGVLRFRPGESGEGGDGITVVWLDVN
ncbi:MAG TPA: endonuclease MutS2 [Kofleriaceae bacterium]|nr:endonuclease MutS2 [Kofleriaceae bacterium]